MLIEKREYQLKNPGLTATIDGKNKTLYLPLVQSIEQATRHNLSKTLHELKIEEGSEIVVADVTTPSSLVFRVHYED